MRRAAAAMFAVSWMAAAHGEAIEAIDASTGLVIKPGWELVRAHCGGCHSHQIVTRQRADRQTWIDIIRWMQETQNLWQFETETEAQIVEYLATSYPPQPNRRRAPIPPRLMPPAVNSDE